MFGAEAGLTNPTVLATPQARSRHLETQPGNYAQMRLLTRGK